MGAGHSHLQLGDGSPGSSRRRSTRRPAGSGRAGVLLLVVLVPVLAATLVAGVWLWPHGTAERSDLAVTPASETPTVSARVLSTAATSCPGTSEDRLPDGDIPATVTCATARVAITSGRDAGARVRVAVPPPVYRSGVEPGTVIRLALYPPEATDDPAEDSLGTLPDGNVYAWADFSRGAPLGFLAVVFAVLVVTVGRFRGLAALIGLGLAGLAVGTFMLPALQRGENPVAVAVVCSIAIMTVLLYLAHGLSIRTTTALLGTIAGLCASAGLAGWASHAAHLNGLGSEDNYTLSTLTTGADLSGVILCGIILASLGVLNDVTVTQASAVWELHEHAPHLPARGLFRSGMRVGRDHLASTVYTIVFAYCGAALPTLLLIQLYQRPLGQVLTSVDIAEELARTFIGSIGLVLAIPLTTAIAAITAAAGGPGLDNSGTVPA